MQMPDAFVSLKQYLCAVGEYGGNENAKRMLTALRAVIKGTSYEGELNSIPTDEIQRLINGQGKPRHIRTVMEMIWENREGFKTYKEGGKTTFTKYFDKSNPLQEMVTDAMFGMDCIGFVGRYMEASGIMTEYPPFYPRNYLDRFFPIDSIWKIDSCAVLVWVKGVHIAVIDSVVQINGNAKPPHAIVNICQSSSGGPQINSRVKLQPASGEYIDFGPYGKEVDGKKVTEEEKEALRKKYTFSGAVGYRQGMFFDVLAGDPAPPVRGHVYVGVMPKLNKVWEPTIELD